MHEQFEIGGVSYSITKDYEEFLIVNFLLNPSKFAIFVKPIELLLPCSGQKFSPIVTMGDCQTITFLGFKFKYKTFDIPCDHARVFNNVDIFGLTNLNFFTKTVMSTERLMAVRQ